MFNQLFLGSLVIPITIFVQIIFIQVAVKQLQQIGSKHSFVQGKLKTLPA